MEEINKTLREIVEELFNVGKFDDVIELLTDDMIEKEMEKAAEFYVWRGNAWYDKKDFDGAIEDFSKAIEINPNYELAFYNKGHALVAKRKYVDAIADFNKVIEFDPDSASAYLSRASVWRVMKDYDKAIVDYNMAIEKDPNDENAYYNRGLAKIEKNVDPEGSKKDFEKYLELTIDKNEIWARYAKNYIEELNEKIEDPDLWDIRQLVNDIKAKLLIEEECVHYTKFSTLKKLILEGSKFQISEGNFMNDPSEGKEFFDFLKYKPYIYRKNDSYAEIYSPKPFIGSFVAKGKNNDLNMWRFYGKEDGVEAKGCAITLRTQEFIEDIKNSLSNERNKEARIDDESDIKFYRVVYNAHGTTNFYVPNLNSKKNNELKDLMVKLRMKVRTYKTKEKTLLEACLYNIAFLFKSDSYKNENEVRLVVKGIEFPKKYDMDVIPPRVYIELESIKKRVKQITFGPKVDNVNEWASAFHYIYEDDAPEILISHLPYK